MNQKNITIFSMLAIVLGAVLVNEIIIRQSDTDQNRQVASLGERFEPNQIKWEHELAKTVSQDEKQKILMARKPNLQDRLMYELFEGKYEAKLVEGQIKKISLIQSQMPIELKTVDFMNNYTSTLKNYDTYTQTAIDVQHEEIHLKDKTGSEVGLLKIERDDQGRVLNIEIQ